MVVGLFRSSKAAIDLASIMVGIIVIGLIGGVIAATVFAVIPWAQDNAAKQQLDAVVQAQSAHAGLSADANNGVVPGSDGVVRFGDLQALADADLFTVDRADGSRVLADSNNLCVAATGAGFRAEIRSASGNAFFVTDKSSNPQRLEETDLSCLPVEEGTVVEADYSISGFRTEGATVDGRNEPILFVEGLTVRSDSAALTDWTIELDISAAPFSYIVVDNSTVVTGLPGWAKAEVKGSTVVISNTTEASRVGGSQTQVLNELRFNYDVPSWTAAQMQSSAFYDVSTSGANAVRASIDVSLRDVTERRYGSWSVDVDASTLRSAVGRDGALSVTSGAAANGLSVERKSGQVYTVTYAPGNHQSFMVKGRSATPQSFSPSGAAVLPNVFVYTASSAGGSATYTSADGRTTVTVGAPSSSNPPTVPTSFTTNVSGTWSVDINLKELRDMDRSKTPRFNNTNFSLVQKSGDVYTLSFTGSWNSGAGQTTNSIQLQ